MHRFRELPAIRTAAKALRRVRQRWAPKPVFETSSAYWEQRYVNGGNSGPGSYQRLADFKAAILNAWVEENDVETVVEFGCGDGNQLSLARYPRYLGFDISTTAVQHCRERFASDDSKTFGVMADYAGEVCDLALSLDVIFHLVEDAVFDRYMHTLLGSASRYVIVYSSNEEKGAREVPHVRHRAFTSWIDENARGWRLSRHVPNRYPFEGDQLEGSFADFYIYEPAARVTAQGSPVR